MTVFAEALFRFAGILAAVYAVTVAVYFILGHGITWLNDRNPARRIQKSRRGEIRKREVYTKTTKGLVSVRKFISWKTNKEDVDETYPPYVFAYVDYSPGRKKPLARTVRSAPSEEVVDELFDSFVKENVKRGWKPAGA